MSEPGIITEIKQEHLNKKLREEKMSKDLTIINNQITEAKADFQKLAKVHGAVDFEVEASYAMQVMKSNSFLAKIALSNPESLKYAVLNVASIGLTLNPVSKHAYLVPRSGSVTLDISYMGMVQLACDAGSLKWVQAQLVHENDHYQFCGVGEKPDHRFNAFKDRGPIVGVYCVAKTEDGEYLTEQMSIDDCYHIRDRSEAWKRNKSGPWKTDEGEMIKKTVIKRAFKLWPKNDKTDRLGAAIAIDNKHNGIDFETEAVEVVPDITESQVKAIGEMIAVLGKAEDDNFYQYVSRVCKRDIAAITDLNAKEANTLMIQLEQFIKVSNKGNE